MSKHIIFKDDEVQDQQMEFYINAKNKVFIKIEDTSDLSGSGLQYISLDKIDLEIMITELIKLKDIM